MTVISNSTSQCYQIVVNKCTLPLYIQLQCFHLHRFLQEPDGPRVHHMDPHRFHRVRPSLGVGAIQIQDQCGYLQEPGGPRVHHMDHHRFHRVRPSPGVGARQIQDQCRYLQVPDGPRVHHMDPHRYHRVRPSSGVGTGQIVIKANLGSRQKERYKVRYIVKQLDITQPKSYC